MRKVIFLIWICLFAGCSDDNPDDGNKPEVPNTEITVPPTESLTPVFNETGGEATVTFTATKSWTASVVNTRADSWLEVSPTQGQAGEVTLKIITKENETPDERSASVILKSGSTSKTIQVTQKQKNALTITASKLEVGAEGGLVSVEVKSNVKYTYEVDHDCKEWIKVAETRGLQTSSVTFSIASNRELEKRQGSIRFTDGTLSETVTVYQSNGTPQIVISQSELTVASKHSDITIEVEANVNVEVSIPEAGWIRENKTRSYSTNTYYFTVDENASYNARSAEIIFANKENSLKETVKVTQMQKDALVVAKSEYIINPEGGNLSFNVQASSIPGMAIECDGGWITQVDTRSLDNYAYHFTVDKLTTDNGREGKIIFSAGELRQTVAIRQKGLKEVRDRETQIMHELYNALKLNDTDYELLGLSYNWNINTPIEKWYGVTIVDGHITEIRCPSYKSNVAARICAKGHIPASIGELTQLKSFTLNDPCLALLEPIPAEIGNLKHLELLRISACNIPGPIPPEIGNLTNLKLLDLSCEPAVIDKTGYHTDFDPYARVEIPNEIGRLTQLESLKIYWLLQGDITTEIQHLKQLKELELIQPSYITVSDYSSEEIPAIKIGIIPEAISGMEKLEKLNLRCGFSGEFPSSIGGLRNLKSLSISSDFLTGIIPESIGQLRQLEYLSIHCKQMNGELPESLGQLGNLETLWVYDSSFTGPIPTSLGNCKKLSAVNLANCNFTSFPNTLSFILDDKENCCLNNDVGIFDISGNRITGKIPDEILTHPNFYLFAANFLMHQQSGYGFDLNDFKYPACKETYPDCFSNQSINFAKEYAANKYTLIFRYNNNYNMEESAKWAVVVNRMNEKYAAKGLKVICGLVNVSEERNAQLKAYAQTLKLADFPHFIDNMGAGYTTPTPFFNDYVSCTRTVPTLGLVDKEGTYVAIAGGNTTYAYDNNYRNEHILSIEQFENMVDNLFH